MLYFGVNIYNETPEVIIIDSDALRTKLKFWRNRKRDRSLIFSVNRYGCYWFFLKTLQYLQSVSFKFEYKLNFLHKNHKR